MSCDRKKVAYIYDETLENECNRLPTMLKRASLVENLINSYGLLSITDDITVVRSVPATEEELKLFHSSGYIDFLKNVDDCEDLEELEDEAEEYGLSYDCPLLDNIFKFVSTIAGGSVTAAKVLLTGQYDTVINWFGGWHHAQRDSAEGFCYVNDIVLAIEVLVKKFKKILYIDLDVHHGNGVQNAFEYSNKVLTLSFHKMMPGFYPGSGSLEEVGLSKGKFYSLNVPFHEGISDTTLVRLFTSIFPVVCESFQPEAMVIQCGGDILFQDPVGSCNVSLDSLGTCFQQILDKNLPMLVLGGGGYNFANTARYWTYLTGMILGRTLQTDIPNDCEDFLKFGPTFELTLESGNMKDCNSKEYVNSVISTIVEYCDNLNTNNH